MKVESKITENIYEGEVTYELKRDKGKGVVKIDSKVLVSYEKVSDSKTLKRLFREDCDEGMFEVLESDRE